MRQGFRVNACLTLALFAGFVVGFCGEANAGLTTGVRCRAGQVAFAAGACAGSFAGGVMSALFGGPFSSPGNCSSSLPAMAARMKLIQMGSAVTAPVSLSPRDSRLSLPTQTPQVTEGEKPRNQASVKSLVVPVLQIGRAHV